MALVLNHLPFQHCDLV